jgi:hypothetical protein
VTEPFITFYTPTYKRPQALAACLASVGAQTAVAHVEQLVIPDHVGVGIDGMYARVPQYAQAVHGRYVHVLADDDVLAGPHVVQTVMDFADTVGDPDVIVVRAQKGCLELPIGPPWPPVCGQIDLGCVLTRRDLWKAHCTAYGRRYEGDYDFAEALFLAGARAAFCPVLFMTGAVRHGAPEAVA